MPACSAASGRQVVIPTFRVRDIASLQMGCSFDLWSQQVMVICSKTLTLPMSQPTL